jgi:hypothetical protein
MNKEDKIIIAFVFNRAGKKEMSFSELFLTLSIDLKWFRPDEAKKFINKSVETYLLKHEKNIIKPNFNIESIKVPTGFYPSKKTSKNNNKTKENFKKNKNENILDIIVEKIIEKSNLNKKTILNQIKEKEKEKNIITEISAVLVGKEYTLNFGEILQKIQKIILTDHK